MKTALILITFGLRLHGHIVVPPCLRKVRGDKGGATLILKSERVGQPPPLYRQRGGGFSLLYPGMSAMLIPAFLLRTPVFLGPMVK
jgi:hypothetical protein